MKTSTKLIALILAGMMTLPVITSCSGNTDAPEGTTTAGTTTEAVTTEALPDDSAIKEAIAANKYGNAGYELTQKILKDYYTVRTHYVKSERGKSGQATVWGIAGLMEALSDCYALYPEDEEVKKAYIDVMTNGIDKYKVENASIKKQRGITYYNAGAGGKGDFYYDDNAWICYQFFRAYELLGDEQFLTRGEELLKFFWTGWDDTLGGGIYWDKSFGGKNTCSDGPIAICYLWGYQLTKNEDYLEKGTMIYDWMHETLMDKNDNLYIDNITVNGNKNNWKSDYNQGTPIYAGCLLYEITGDETYLTQAKKTAAAALGLAFNVSGRGDKATVTMKGNPIYRSWCVAWLMRGFVRYAIDSGKTGSYVTYMEKVLDATMAASTDGYYDPYFLSGDWKGESVLDVLQPCGVASTMLICAYFDVYQAPKLK